MKRWLSYILMAVLCGLYLSSCAKDEEVAKATDGGKVPVRLTLAFSNFGGRAASEPGDLDYMGGIIILPTLAKKMCALLANVN